MKSLIAAALAALFSLPASAGDKPLDEANAKLSSGQASVKSGAKKLENDTNQGLLKARKNGRKAARQLEDGANDAAHRLRQKLGTEK